MIRQTLWFGVVLVASCAQFNRPLTVADRVLVVSTGSNKVLIYGVQTATGALTFQTSITTTSPSNVLTHPSDEAFYVYRGSSAMDCYRYNARDSTGPTLESSTTFGNLTAMAITPDGKAIVYGKSGDPTLYWRTISQCSIAGENSVSRTGLQSLNTLSFSDNGTVGVLCELFPGKKATKINRNTSTGALTLGDTFTQSGNDCRATMLPGGQYALLRDNTTLGVWGLAGSAVQNVGTGGTSNLDIPLSDSRSIQLRTAFTHLPISISSAGIPSTGAMVDYGIPDFTGGAISPERKYIYTGDQTTPAVWIHPVQSANPFIGTPTQVTLTDAPDAIGYLRSYSR